MNQTFTRLTGVALLIAAIASCNAVAQTADKGPSEALHQGQSHVGLSETAGPHGGSVRQANGVQIETVVNQGGIQLFLYDRADKPMAVNQGRGVASLRVTGNAKRYRYDLLPDGKGALTAPVNLAKIAGRQIELEIQLIGISAAIGRIALQEVASVPLSEMQLAEVAIARQKICPVSGKPLGSMGQPVVVDVDGGQVYVCCAGCADAVKADPAKYAGGRAKITVTPLTEADTALIKKQAKCPVMDESLGSMGQPIKVMVGDKPIFLCCKGCIKKIKAEPAKYLAMVSDKTPPGQASAKSAAFVPAGSEKVRDGVFKVSTADAPFIAAQKRCPVMDEPLDAMGGPYKVNASGKAIYICCPGCAKKIVADPKKYLDILTKQGVKAPVIQAKLDAAVVPAGGEKVRDGVFKVSTADAPFIAAQKRCPVMDEPLDAMGGPYKVNASGKAIYICCPGCAKKIVADPKKYLDILTKQGVTAPLLR